MPIVKGQCQSIAPNAAVSLSQSSVAFATTMPDPNDAYDENVPGAWYVDKSCIFCGLCNSIAPDNFAESEDGTHDYVYKQPATPEEVAACEDAMAQCPVNSIGKDRA